MTAETATASRSEHVETIVVGGGQAGLCVGYHLGQTAQPFRILDANARVGDAWRHRWDSLRLFTPARFDGLPGMPFPADPYYFPTKDEMAGYLASYAEQFSLPVESGTRVQRLTRNADAFELHTNRGVLTADNVVVAMGSYQRPRTPSWARNLDPDITQLHSFEYRNPAQLRPGSVLLVGAGNSAAEIAVELAPTHTVSMAGRNVGHLPFRIDSGPGRVVLAPIVLRGVFHRLLTTSTPVGRKVRAKVLHRGGPWIRTKPKNLTAAGVMRLPRAIGVRDGLLELEDGRAVEVDNIIWCTGFGAGLEWIDLPVFDDAGPLHRDGIVDSQPGLYFVGLHFLHSLSSAMIHGVDRDAQRVVAYLTSRQTPSRAHATGAAAVVAAWLPQLTLHRE